MTQYMPTMIMFALAVVLTILLLLPTYIRFGNDLIRFYWKGFWMFLALVAFIAFGSQSLILAGYDVNAESIAILTGIITVFPIFVVFGWFRIVGFMLFKKTRLFAQSV